MGEITAIMARVNEIAASEVDTKFGTSLDKSLNGELRVSVVATGLGGLVAEVAPIRSDNKVVVPLAPRVAPMGEVRHQDYTLPPGTRGMTAASNSPINGIAEEEFLNIPAFLRHQAD